MTASPAPQEQAPRQYSETAATHIRELSSINQRIPELLRKSATAISLLTNRPVEQPEPIHDAATRLQVIQDTSNHLFLLINRTRILLHNQTNELQSEKVIPAELTRFSAQMEESTNLEAGVTNGGLGEVNIADLNARAGVRQQGDDEILGRVHGILGDLMKRANNEGEEMAVDL